MSNDQLEGCSGELIKIGILILLFLAFVLVMIALESIFY